MSAEDGDDRQEVDPAEPDVEPRSREEGPAKAESARLAIERPDVEDEQQQQAESLAVGLDRAWKAAVRR